MGKSYSAIKVEWHATATVPGLPHASPSFLKQALTVPASIAIQCERQLQNEAAFFMFTPKTECALRGEPRSSAETNLLFL